MRPFPLSAVVGQRALVEALLACAVDPAIGGVLVRGERGTAKSTAVRALAGLLDGAPLVELPVGATVDRLLGSLDVERALGGGEAVLVPGLLASADGGLLYADEVNLLPDALVDVLLDAAASGVVRVEREGLSAAAPARFVLVGTMNPEEGELRPQLLDRFGLSVEVRGSGDAAERVEVVRRRLAFDADPAGFVARFEADERALASRILAARGRLSSVTLGDRMLLLIASVCAELGVDGMRADIVCARCACALAALDGTGTVTEDHVRRAARLALAHRRRRGPLDAPGLDEDELSRAMAGAPDDEPDPDPGGGGSAVENGVTTTENSTGVMGDASPTATAVENGATMTENSTGVARERRVAAGAPVAAPRLVVEGAGRGAAGRRSRARGVGAPVDARVPAGTVTDLAVAATLRAAARRGARRPEPQDLREHVRAGREGNLIVLCVDASGSMGARRRMTAAKGAVLGLLLDAYQRRDRVAMVTFRAEHADVVLPPTNSVDIAARALDDLATGGATPIARGLHTTADLIATHRRRDPDRRALALVITDGRASGGPHGRAAARDAAALLARHADRVVVFDAEEGRVRLGLAGELAEAAGARLLPMTALPTPPRSAAA